MKLNRLTLDLLQYLRANLVFAFRFKSQKMRNLVTVSSPVDTEFEIFTLEQAIMLIESMINTKYPTSLDFDLKVLEALNSFDPNDEDSFTVPEGDPDHEKIKELLFAKCDALWRYKLALIHRLNQKEILHN